MRFSIVLLSLLAGLALVSGAYAQTALKADSKQPIDITSDALEVLQEEQVAIFTGNVVAVQGKMKLTSQVMKVHYKAAGDNAKEGEQGISRIEVDGNVFLQTPDETARGKAGVYDVDKERLTLNGDVVLTRGENIVKGEALQYDLATGRSRILGAGVTAESLKTGEGSGQKGRVRGRFVPENKDSGSAKPSALKVEEATPETASPPTPVPSENGTQQ